MNLSEANYLGPTSTTANLDGANLRRASIAEANFSHADLSGTNLVEAQLSGSNFGSANLCLANLYLANLTGTDLTKAELFLANLTEANLRGTDFTGANLAEANLSRAYCEETIFVNVDLSEARGLDSISHFGPSSIGIDSIFHSTGKIPTAFLRGCGVPESLINSLPQILSSTEPIQFYSCFISYSSKNQVFTQRLHADLRANGVRPWFDGENLKIGDKIRSRTSKAIRDHDRFMLVLSEDTIASDWVEGEVEAARDPKQA